MSVVKNGTARQNVLDRTVRLGCISFVVTSTDKDNSTLSPCDSSVANNNSVNLHLFSVRFF